MSDPGVGVRLGLASSSGPGRSHPDEPQLPPWVAELARTWDIRELVERIVVDDIAAAFPDMVGDADFADQLRSSATENVSHMRSCLAGELNHPDVRLVAPVEFAITQANLGIRQSQLQHSYRVGFINIWKEWTSLLRDRSEALGLDESELAMAMAASTLTLLRYQDYSLRRVAEGYTRQDELLRRSGEQVRRQAVRELLDGGSDMHPEDLLPTLGYDVSAVHLVVLLKDVSVSAARRLAAQLVTAGGASESLVVSFNSTDTVIWLGRRRTWPCDMTEAVLAHLRTTGRVASVSRTAASIAGFRSGYAEAMKADSIRQVWRAAPAVLQYSEVQLDALLIADLPAAKQFVEQELGPLAADNDTAARLRETLLMSFKSNSHIAVAERMMLHEHTVRNRLRAVEQLLARPLTERRMELMVALRIRALLGEQYRSILAEGPPPA